MVCLLIVAKDRKLLKDNGRVLGFSLPTHGRHLPQHRHTRRGFSGAGARANKSSVEIDERKKRPSAINIHMARTLAVPLAVLYHPDSEGPHGSTRPSAKKSVCLQTSRE